MQRYCIVPNQKNSLPQPYAPASGRKGNNMRMAKIIVDAPPVNKEEVAQIMAYYITGGDPVGYLARLAEKQEREMFDAKG